MTEEDVELEASLIPGADADEPGPVTAPLPKGQTRLDRSFVRHIAATISGGIGAQLILVAGAPILTRLFDVKAFGVYGVYFAAVGVLSLVVCLRLDQAIPLPEDDAEAEKLLAAGLVTSAGGSVVIGLLLAGAVQLGWVDTESDLVGLLVAMVAAGVFAEGAQKVLIQWGARCRRFSAIAWSRVIFAGGIVVGQILAGLVSADAASLVAGDVVGRMAGALSLVLLVGLALGAVVRRHARDAWSVLGKYRRFPLFAMPASAVNLFSAQIPIVIGLPLFGATVAGLLTLSLRVLQAPLTIVMQNVAQVFYPTAVDAHRTDDLDDVAFGLHEHLLALLAGPAAALVFLLPDAFSFVFGDEWSQAGVYAQLLLPWLVFEFAVQPLTNLVFVLDRQPAHLAFNLALMVVRVVALLIGWAADSTTAAVGFFAAVSFVGWVGYGQWLLGLAGTDVGRRLRLYWSLSVRVALTALPVGVLVLVGVPFVVEATVAGLVVCVYLMVTLRAQGLRSTTS